MAVTDLASAAAAVSAGYTKVQIDRGATPGPNDKNPAPRFATVFAKTTTGATGDSGRQLEGHGESNSSAAAADTQALAALNANRRHYYGGSPGRASAQSESPSSRGGSHTVEVT